MNGDVLYFEGQLAQSFMFNGADETAVGGRLGVTGEARGCGRAPERGV